MIDTKEMVEEPLQVSDLPVAKPSDILKSMPREKWGKHGLKWWETGQMCAVGYLADVENVDWSKHYNPKTDRTNSPKIFRFVQDRYGLTSEEISQIADRNDGNFDYSGSLDEVIAYLEGIGK